MKVKDLWRATVPMLVFAPVAVYVNEIYLQERSGLTGLSSLPVTD